MIKDSFNMELMFTHGASSTTFRAISTMIEDSKVDCLQLALSTVDLSRNQIDPMGFASKGGGYTVWHAGAVILAALSHIKVRQLSIPQEIKMITPEIGNPILKAATGLTTESHAGNGENLGEEAGLSLLAATYLPQISLQGDYTTQFVRTLFLLELDNLDTVGIKQQSFFDPLFREIYGCSTLEYASLLFALWSTSLKFDIISASRYLEKSKNRDAIEPLLEKVLADISIPVEKVRDYLDGDLKAYQGNGIVQAFCTTKPVVRLSEDEYLLLVHPFLRLVASNGIWFRTLRLAIEDAERRGSKKPWTNIYSSRMGKRFEVFLHFLFKKMLEPEYIVQEYRYLEGSDSPDFFLLDPNDPDAVIVVQAKLKRLSPETFFGFDLKKFEEDASGVLAETLWKTIKYFYQVDRAITNGKNLGANPEFSRKMNAIKKIILLGIVPTMPSMFHFRAFRIFVFRGALKNLNKDERKWFVCNRHRFVGWHIMDSEEIASFVASKGSTYSFWDALREYMERPEFGFILGDNEMMPNFRSWHLKKFAIQPVKQLKEFSECFERFTHHTIDVVLGGRQK